MRSEQAELLPVVDRRGDADADGRCRSYAGKSAEQSTAVQRKRENSLSGSRYP